MSRAVVASPHHLASEAGADVLSRGGNAVDAAVATNLVLGVVTPYYCGPGGDAFAIVWDGAAHGMHSHGAAPGGATPEAVRAAVESHLPPDHDSLPWTHGMPMFGALPVTVPGAVLGWFELLERWGTRSFGDLSRRAHEIAATGLRISAAAGEVFERGVQRHGDQGAWGRLYGDVRRGDRWTQPEHAAFLDLLAEDGPDAYYRGPVAEEVVAATRAGGSTMSMEDLASHEVRWADPLRVPFRDVEVLELGPPTQGPTAAQLLRTVEKLPATQAPGPALHRRVEATRAALADRERYITDPEAMAVAVDELLADDRIRELADRIGERAGAWPPATPRPGGTAYLCAADEDGLLVSLIQSNYMGFGSGVALPSFGFGLQNRGAHFSLDPDDANVIAPGKRSLHTLIPGLVLRDGRPSHVFGTMGGDGQPQIHLQVLEQLLVRGRDPEAAVAAPRWIVSAADGTVTVEPGIDAALVADLRDRGHRVTVLSASSGAMGHAHAIEVHADGSYSAGADPRAESGVGTVEPGPLEHQP